MWILGGKFINVYISKYKRNRARLIKNIWISYTYFSTCLIAILSTIKNKIKIQLCTDYLFRETVHLPLSFSNWLDPIVITDRSVTNREMQEKFSNDDSCHGSSVSHERVLRKLGRERERERRKANLPITARSSDPYARSMIGRVIYGLDVLRKSIFLSLLKEN